MDEHSLSISLQGLVPALQYLDVTTSTNDVAHAWAKNDAADFSLVVADSQTSGRGRSGRRWLSQPSASLIFSLILRPSPQEISCLSLFSPLGALAVSLALDQYGIETQVKWPNDVLVKNKKFCGILVELQWLADQLQYIVLGIGVNVTPASVPPQSELNFPATCLEQALGYTLDRSALLTAIIQNIHMYRRNLLSGKLISDWESRLAFRGEWVIHQPGYLLPTQSSQAEKVLGITQEGGLRLCTANGSERIVTTGELSFRPVEISPNSILGD